MSNADELRYPVGRFQFPSEAISGARRREWIASLAATPAALRRLVSPLGDADLARCYRPGGWSIRQLTHHLPDSHLNAYIRMKWALTEDQPAIKTYQEDRWAQLPDAAAVPVSVSLDLLAALHLRWCGLLDALPEADFARVFVHPEWGNVRLDGALAQYEWHGRHHLAHIRLALG